MGNIRQCTLDPGSIESWNQVQSVFLMNCFTVSSLMDANSKRVQCSLASDSVICPRTDALFLRTSGFRLTSILVETQSFVWFQFQDTGLLLSARIKYSWTDCFEFVHPTWVNMGTLGILWGFFYIRHFVILSKESYFR